MRLKTVKYEIIPRRVRVGDMKVIFWELRRSRALHVFYVAESRDEVIAYFKEKIDHYSHLTALTIANDEGKFIRYIWSTINSTAQIEFKERFIDDDFYKETHPAARYVIGPRRHRGGASHEASWYVRRVGSLHHAFVAPDKAAAIDFYMRAAVIANRPSLAYILRDHGRENRVERLIRAQIVNGKLVIDTQYIGRDSRKEYYIMADWTRNSYGVTEKLWGIRIPGQSSFIYASQNRKDVERYFKRSLDHRHQLGVAYVYGGNEQFEKIIRARTSPSDTAEIVFDEQLVADLDEVTRETTLNTSTAFMRFSILAIIIITIGLCLVLGLFFGHFF